MTFDWASATTLPTVIVSAASSQSAAAQSAWSGRIAIRTRRSAPKAAAFEPVAMNAATAVGAPW